MSTEIDAATTHQLAQSVNTLNSSVVRLETLMGQFGPILQSQVNGLTNVDNRVSRIEDWRITFEKKCAEDKLAAEKKAEDDKKEAEKLAASAKKEQDDRITGNRWLVGITLTAIGVLLGVLGFVANHITFK